MGRTPVGGWHPVAARGSTARRSTVLGVPMPVPPVADSLVPVLHVCVTCRTGLPPTDGEATPGRRLYDAVAALLDAGAPAVRLREVACLSSCDAGCAAAISAPGKWSYLLGRLDAGLAADVLAYAEAYARSKTGTVLPSRRPASLARMVLGRMPDLAALDAAPAPAAPNTTGSASAPAASASGATPPGATAPSATAPGGTAAATAPGVAA